MSLPPAGSRSDLVTLIELHGNQIVVDLIANRPAADELLEGVGHEESGLLLRDDLGTAYRVFAAKAVELRRFTAWP